MSSKSSSNKSSSNKSSSNKSNSNKSSSNKSSSNKSRSNKCCSKKCKGCVCRQLRKLQKDTIVDLLISGTVIKHVVLVKFNKKTCCAHFSECETESGSIIVVDCSKIDAIRYKAHDL